MLNLCQLLSGLIHIACITLESEKCTQKVVYRSTNGIILHFLFDIFNKRCERHYKFTEHLGFVCATFATLQGHDLELSLSL